MSVRSSDEDVSGKEPQHVSRQRKTDSRSVYKTTKDDSCLYSEAAACMGGTERELRSAERVVGGVEEMTYMRWERGGVVGGWGEHYCADSM